MPAKCHGTLEMRLRTAVYAYDAKTMSEVADCCQGRFKGGGQRGRPLSPVKILAPPVPPNEMIKHNLPLVRGGSLWQYRSVPPAAIMATPLPPIKNVNPRTANDCCCWKQFAITRNTIVKHFADEVVLAALAALAMMRAMIISTFYGARLSGDTIRYDHDSSVSTFHTEYNV